MMNLDLAQKHFLLVSPPPISDYVDRRTQEISITEESSFAGARINIVDAQDASRTARLLESQGDLPGAAEAYRRLAQLRPTAASFLVLGITYYKIGQYERAIESLKRSLSVGRKAQRSGASPDMEAKFWAHFALALVYARTDKPWSALSEIIEGSKTKPQSALAQLLLGDIRRRLQQWPEAVAAFERAIEFDPNLRDAYFYLADLYAKLANRTSDGSQREEAMRLAITTYKRLIARFPSGSSQAHNNLGVLLSMSGDTESALFEYKAALQTDPKNIRAQINLATAYLASDRLEEAKHIFDRVVLLSMNNPRLLSREDATRLLEGNAITLVKLYSEEGKDDSELLAQAEASLRKAIELDPASPQPRNNLATLYAGAGRFDEAENQFNQVLLLEPGNQFARAGLSEVAVARFAPKEPGDPEEERRVSETLKFLEKFREEGNEEEQRETFALLKRYLEEDRLSNRSLFDRR